MLTTSDVPKNTAAEQKVITFFFQLKLSMSRLINVTSQHGVLSSDEKRKKDTQNSSDLDDTLRNIGMWNFALPEVITVDFGTQ